MERETDTVTTRGRAWYAKIRDAMEEAHWGRMVVIDVASGDYEIGNDDCETTMRLLQRRPGALTWGELVGFAATCGFNGPPRELPRRAKTRD